jgi:hypothetical protein
MALASSCIVCTLGCITKCAIRSPGHGLQVRLVLLSSKEKQSNKWQNNEAFVTNNANIHEKARKHVHYVVSLALKR